MKDIAFLLADVWMIFVGYFYGWRFIRRYGNHLLGIEWMVVATSGTNFLVWALLGSNEESVFYDVAYFFDAFSRSVGITLVLVLGLLAVTHRYKPPLAVEMGVFGLAVVAGLYFRQFAGEELHVVPATFFVVTNLLTTLFLAFVAKRLWDADARPLAIATGVVTLAAAVIAWTYDFFPFSFDDPDRTFFYTAALATWGTQGFVYFLAYRALHDHNVATRLRPTQTASTAS
jgi:hypothetical protein